MRRALTLTLPLAVVLLLALWRGQGPAPLDANAPERAFSATRALTVLRGLLAEGVPHPVGSPANARVRQRLEARFRALGYDTTVQRRFACNGNHSCAMVENLLARAPGAAAGDVVLLAAHYDSVGAGPGASDDGQGTATLLEIARAIRGERFRNRVAFLLTDGEEAGLIGAEAFVADESLLRDVAAAINVEMRGTYGTSNLFETSRGNRWLIRHLSGALQRPLSSSLFYAVYNLLPNDTDVTVFKRAGKAAVNFAGIGGVQWYHTPLDDLAHVSPRTLQHHGDNALAALRALAGEDLAARSRTDATWFDVLSFFIVWWPQEWILWIGVGSLLLLVFAARHTAPRAMTFGVLATFAALLFAALGGAALAWITRLRSSDIPFAAYQLPSVATMWLTGIAAALLAAALFNRRNDPKAMLYGVAIVWHFIGIALAILLPGAAYLFLVPALALTICALLRASEIATSAVAATVAALLMFPLGTMLYTALGGAMMASIALLLGAFATLVAPLFPRPRNAAIAGVLAVICALIALATPAYIRERPRIIPLAYVDDPAAKTARWITYDLTEPLRHAAPFANADPSLTPWYRGTAFSAPAPALALPRVTLSATRTATGATIRVLSHRNANRMSLFLRGGKITRINGVTPPPPPTRNRARYANGWEVAVASGVQEMLVDVTAQGRIEVIANDTTFGFPTEGAALLSARSASVATTIQDGDVTVTRARGTY
jgi:hypothetical protein